MNKSRLLVLLSGLMVGLVFAETKDKSESEKIIYKWQGDDGLLHYTHIKPVGIKDFDQLDTNGRKVEDYSENFGEVVEIVVRPTENAETPKEGLEKEEADKIEANRQKELMEKNCKTAQNNMNTLGTGEVYEKDAEGNMVRLNAEQVEIKKTNVRRDMDYFCSPAASTN